MTGRRKRPTANLGQLLGESAELLKETQATSSLPVEALTAGQGQPRREFNEGKLEELAASIREKGVLQPLLVRPAGDGYEIVAGERRWRAAKLAGLTEVPVVIREFTDSEARQAALIENLQREGLNTVDEVDAKLDLVALTLGLSRDDAQRRLMQLLREEPGAEHEALTALFAALGEQWTSFTRNKLKILKWPAAILNAVRGGLPYRLGQVIAGAPETHHAHLIDFALAGASLSELQAELSRLNTRPTAPAQAVQVGRLLTSARWMGKLDARQQKDVNAWLSKMPAVLRESLDS